VVFIGWDEFRSNQSRVIHAQLKGGIEISGALDIVQNSIVVPYACIWYVSGRKSITTRDCKMPTDTELNSIRGFSGSILVVYKGFLDSSHFKILFGEKFVVLSVEELVYEDAL